MKCIALKPIIPNLLIYNFLVDKIPYKKLQNINYKVGSNKSNVSLTVYFILFLYNRKQLAFCGLFIIIIVLKPFFFFVVNCKLFFLFQSIIRIRIFMSLQYNLL